MAINFNTDPYNDDFDETKNYHRILFKPGYAVQARELTQLQTQLQNQLSKVGNHLFVDGSVILDGEKFFETKLKAIKIEKGSVDLNYMLGATITGANVDGNGFRAIGYVKNVQVGDTYNTIVIKPLSGPDFSDNETINYTYNSIAYTATAISTNAISDCITFSVKAGVFYINGHFVYTDAQSIIVDTPVDINSASWVIGFVANETFVTAEDDETLLDNAQGTPNYAAPGADRYNIDLVLTAKTPVESVDNFVELARIESGQLIVNDDKTVYSEIGKEFARRTYDESGDYTVTNFALSLKENFYKTTAGSFIVGNQYEITSVGSTDFTLIGASANTVGVVFIASGVGSGSGQAIDRSKFIVALDPGKAYIKGYEFETKNQNYLLVDKARTVTQADNINIANTYGNYVYTTNLYGAFTTNASSNPYSTVELHNVARASVSGATSKLGTAKVRTLKLYTGSGSVSTWVYRMYLFDVQMDAGKLFKDTQSIVIRSGGTVLSGTDISTASRPGSETFISGTDALGLVFPLNNSSIKTVKGLVGGILKDQTDYEFQRTYTMSFTNGVSSPTISTNSLSVGNERFFSASTADDRKTYYHLVVTAVSSGTQVAVGDIIDLGANASFTFGGAGTESAAQTLSITVTNANTTTFTGTLIASIHANAVAAKTKALSDYKAVVIATPNTVVGNSDSLGIADGYSLKSVHAVSGATAPVSGSNFTLNTTTGVITWGSALPNTTDITRNYSFDNGQRDDIYDHASIKLTGTAPSSSWIVVVFKNFTHTGDGFLSVDSYSGISYEDIPTFTSPSSNTVYNLRDCIDFRPRRTDNTTTISNGQFPDPAFSVNADYQYYLPRRDRIYATPTRQFVIKQGEPSLEPQTPSEDSGGMTLYTLYVPPYTDNASDVVVSYKDNRRYTMRDIGKLQRRIENVEYYTQLSLLEKQAKDDSILDASAMEKFKQGIVVDPFAGHTVGDASNADYRCSIDLQQRTLRPFVETYADSLAVNTLTNTTRKGDLVVLDYVESEFVNQPFATKSLNINPFNIVAFVGTIDLNPSQDIWVDITTLPPLEVVNEINITRDVFQPLAGRPINTWWWGQPWGWNIGWGWSGWGWGWWNGWNNGSWGGWWGGWNRARIATVTSSTTSVQEDTESLGTSVVDLQFLPFIRQRTILGVATGLKPNARHYPFMDETNVTSYVRPLSKVAITNMTGTLFSDAAEAQETLTFTGGGTAQVAKVGPLVGTSRNVWLFNVSGTINTGTVTGTNSNSATVTSVNNAYALGDALYTDASGLMAFEYQIPGAIFRTGERNFRLIDNIDNDSATSDSSGNTTYFALGQLRTERETLLTTRTITTTNTTTQRVVGWSDPLAQSFLVDSLVYPQGLYISSVDLYFRTKSSTVPVTLELRKMVNGYPEAVSTISFGTTQLFPENIGISEDAATSTKFTFSSPVYLEPGEYCYVLMSNSNEYEVWVAEMGKTILNTNQRMTQQPYAGSLFKSQNSTTWTATQEMDMKFILNRCQFETSGSAVFSIADPYKYATTFNTVSGNPLVTNVPTAAFNNIGMGMIVSSANVISGSQIIDVDPVFTGYISTTTLNVTDVSRGTIKVGMVLTGAGVTPGTVITALGTGLGGVGSYTISTSQTVGSIGSPVSMSCPIIGVVNVSAGNFITGKTYTITSVGTTSFTGIGAAANTVGTTFTATGAGTGTGVAEMRFATLSTNASATAANTAANLYGVYEFQTINVNSSIIEPTATAVSFGVKATEFTPADGSTIAAIAQDSADTPIVNKTDYSYKVIKSVVPASLNSGNSTLKVTATFNSDNDAVSPAIDTARIGVTMVKNVINNNSNNETGNAGGQAVAKYITKAIQLADGFDAGNLSVIIDVYKPADTNVKVYYKALPISSSSSLANQPWVEMNLEKPIATSADEQDYKEHRWFPASAFDAYGVPVTTAPIEPRFTSFAIKVVLLSANEAVAPRLRDFRAIALDV